MEPQQTKQHCPLRLETQQQIKQVIMSTYRGRTQADIKQAHIVIDQSFNDPAFIQKLLAIVSNFNSKQNDIKVGAAGLIKKFSYDFAKQEGDKSSFIEILYNLIMNENVLMKVKELLGGALEHLFIEDRNALYKNIVKQKVLQMICKQDGVNYFSPSIIIFEAYFNSMLAQPQYLVPFFEEIIQPFTAIMMQTYAIMAKMSFEEWTLREKSILPKINALFSFIQSSIQKISQQSDSPDDDMQALRNNGYLVNLLQNSLLLFHNNHSIVSRTYPMINDTKKIVANTVNILYGKAVCPQRIFNIVFLTVLAQCKGIINDYDVQNILVNCLNILESHLLSKKYLNVFSQHKMEFVFALFMYSVTNRQQYQLMQSDPQMFAQIAQSYCQGSVQSTYLKVRAACALRAFAERIDEAPRNILQILMVIMSGSIGVQDQDSQLMQSVKAQFSRFNFYGLSREQKLETSFMILSGLAKHIGIRQEMNKVVYAFFLTQYEALIKIDSPIIILRVVRTISYYPTALYFLYIETQMYRGGIFIIEGFKSLEKIIRTNKHQELYSFLSIIIKKLMGAVKIQDPIMELIVVNYYNLMLKANQELYAICRHKIKQSFFQNYNCREHATFVSFNLLSSLLKKQKDVDIIPLIQRQFFEISAFLQSNDQIEYYSRYQQKLIEIYQIIIEKNYNIQPQVQRFALRSLRFLARQEKGTKMFQFYNLYLVKLDGAIFKLDSYFRAFWQEVKRRFQLYLLANQSLEAIAYYCFLMSQILANHCEILFSQEDLRILLQMAEKIGKDEKQYPIIVFLTYLYVQPAKTLQFLKKYNIYEHFLNGIIKISYEGAIIKKIYNLAFIMLLQIQQDPLLSKQIIIQCIHNLKAINRKTLSKAERNRTAFEVKPRKFGQERNNEAQQQQMQAQQQNDNELINLFVKFRHPFELQSEFDQFRVKVWMNQHLIEDLDADTKNDLRSIMQTEIVGNSKMRIIKKIKR